MIYMFLSNNPSSGDINSSNLPCFDHDLMELFRERSGSVVECLTGDRGASVTRHIYPRLALVLFRKTRPCVTERLLVAYMANTMGPDQTAHSGAV